MNLLDSPVGIFSCWVHSHSVGGNHGLFAAADAINNVVALSIGIFNQAIHIQDGTNAVIVLFSQDPHAFDIAWTHVLASWNIAAPYGEIYINDVLNTGTFSASGTIPWSVTAHVTILNDSFLEIPWHGCVSDFYLNTEEYLDFSLTENRRKFISEALEQVPLGSNGELPTGTAPRFFFTGDVLTFPTNQGTFDGVFTEVGTLINCTDIPIVAVDNQGDGYLTSIPPGGD